MFSADIGLPEWASETLARPFSSRTGEDVDQITSAQKLCPPDPRARRLHPANAEARARPPINLAKYPTLTRIESVCAALPAFEKGRTRSGGRTLRADPHQNV